MCVCGARGSSSTFGARLLLLQVTVKLRIDDYSDDTDALLNPAPFSLSLSYSGPNSPSPPPPAFTGTDSFAAERHICTHVCAQHWQFSSSSNRRHLKGSSYTFGICMTLPTCVVEVVSRMRKVGPIRAQCLTGRRRQHREAKKVWHMVQKRLLIQYLWCFGRALYGDHVIDITVHMYTQAAAIFSRIRPTAPYIWKRHTHSSS